MHSDYHSVTDQSGLYAGKGGFDVNVGNHTQLNGGVIASTSDASDNHLNTSTFGFTDIDNNADYKVSHSGMGYSTGGGAVTQFVSNLQSTTLNTTNHSGHDSSTTHAAVSPGELTISDGDNQTQDVSTLSRDPEHAGNALSPIFDKEKEQRRLDRVQQVSDVGTQLSDIVATDNQIDRINERRKVQDELAQQGVLPPGDGASDADRQAYTNQVNNIVDARVPSRGVGSDAQRLIQSATAVVQGLVSGDIGKGLANASEPELNRLIHQATDKYDLGEQGNLALHAVLGAVIAEVNDNSAISGAAGATSAEALSDAISARYYHKSVAELTDDEKANLSSLTSLAAGLVGAATGDNASDAVRAAGSGKSAVENNSLGDLAAALQQGKTPQQVAKECVEAENERYRKENCAGMSLSACNTKMYKERQEALKEMGLATIDFIPVIGTAKSLYEAESALDYVEAAASLIPLGGTAAKGALKAARFALKEGDLETASRLINKASDDIHVKVLEVGPQKDLKKRGCW